MKLQFFLAFRFVQKKQFSNNGFLSFISLASSLGLALGVASLIIVLSVMNGFHFEMRDRILSYTPQIEIKNSDGVIDNYTDIEKIALINNNVLASAPFINTQVLINTSNTSKGALLRGIDINKEQFVSNINNTIISGSFQELKDNSFCLAIGKPLAHNLNLNLGDKILLLTQGVNMGPVGNIPRQKNFIICSIFEAGMHDIDNMLIFANINDVSKFSSLSGNVNGIRLKLKDPFIAKSTASEIEKNLPIEYFVNDWTTVNANFFSALAMEKTMMFLILMIIIAVAAFNLISALFITVKEKTNEIAILRTFGMSNYSIMTIFTVQGLIIGLLGIFFGIIFGLLGAYNIDWLARFAENLFNFKFLSSDVYYIHNLPSKLDWNDVSKICISSILLTILACIYPAYKASKITPADALKNS